MSKYLQLARSYTKMRIIILEKNLYTCALQAANENCSPIIGDTIRRRTLFVHLQMVKPRMSIMNNFMWANAMGNCFAGQAVYIVHQTKQLNTVLRRVWSAECCDRAAVAWGRQFIVSTDRRSRAVCLMHAHIAEDGCGWYTHNSESVAIPQEHTIRRLLMLSRCCCNHLDNTMVAILCERLLHFLLCLVAWMTGTTHDDDAVCCQWPQRSRCWCSRFLLPQQLEPLPSRSVMWSRQIMPLAYGPETRPTTVFMCVVFRRELKKIWTIAKKLWQVIVTKIQNAGGTFWNK